MRLPALDSLRGAAALAVVGYHLDLIPWGYLGVPVFFAASGYLIGGQLHARRPLPEYTLARVSRVLPLAWTVAILGWSAGYGAGIPLWALLTGQLWLVPGVERAGSPLGVLWSLGVEEVCYLTAPLWVRRPWVGVVLAAGCPLWGLVGHPLSPLTQAGPFALGAMAASTRPEPAVGWAAVAGGLLGLSLGTGPDTWRTACPSAGVLGVGLVLLAARSTWRCRPLEWVGRRCLGVYLLHPWAIMWAPGWAVLPATLAGAEVSWWLVERPSRRAVTSRDIFPPGWSPRNATH